MVPATSSEIFGLDAAPRLRHMAFDAVRRTGDHTVATGLLFAADRLADRIPDGVTRRSISAGRALAREVDEVIGDGVLLHPPFPRTAPRHRMTIGRPWLLANTALFNLLGSRSPRSRSASAPAASRSESRSPPPATATTSPSRSPSSSSACSAAGYRPRQRESAAPARPPDPGGARYPAPHRRP